ncbi:hypothetical protein F5Y06DRAFT_267682 [Hypoxylon sp. FL0890]|nr:hypothetical protein F5Y06DRAFT_267682 [Hypoxylon sp. FL0890]
MDLEVNMRLTEEGVERLASRVTARQIEDEKFDLDIVLRNDEGESVALSHYVCMIVSMENNARETPPNKAAL